jgi:hypothetical protein
MARMCFHKDTNFLVYSALLILWTFDASIIFIMKASIYILLAICTLFLTGALIVGKAYQKWSSQPRAVSSISQPMPVTIIATSLSYSETNDLLLSEKPIVKSIMMDHELSDSTPK